MVKILSFSGNLFMLENGKFFSEVIRFHPFHMGVICGVVP